MVSLYVCCPCLSTKCPWLIAFMLCFLCFVSLTCMMSSRKERSDYLLNICDIGFGIVLFG